MIALVTLVLDTGMIAKDGDEPVIKIDAPPGRAWITGRNEFWFDPSDPLRNGFIFR